ncbi:3-(3-hydroxy-phenyl)propionate_3-hydroxycinnamic acid hydroxylase [Streptomyces sp. enrichment culture]
MCPRGPRRSSGARCASAGRKPAHGAVVTVSAANLLRQASATWTGTSADQHRHLDERADDTGQGLARGDAEGGDSDRDGQLEVVENGTSTGTAGGPAAGSTRPVIVVGAGPTGLLLAGDLAEAGVPVTLLEKRPHQVSNLSRAFGVHARTLEQLDARGLADDLLATGATITRLRLFRRLTLDLSTLPSRFPFLLITPQYEVERLWSSAPAGSASALSTRANSSPCARTPAASPSTSAPATERRPPTGPPTSSAPTATRAPYTAPPASPSPASPSSPPSSSPTSASPTSPTAS